MTLEEVKSEIKSCHKCSRVVGSGFIPVLPSGKPSKIMFVGLCPSIYGGAKTGVPFTGKTSWVFDDFLKIAGLIREEVFVTNLVKCPLPGNDTPIESEIVECLPFLWKEVDAISPEVIVTFGAISSKRLLNMSVLELKDNQEYVIMGRSSGTIRVFPCPHPAYCARFPDQYDVLKKCASRVKVFLKSNCK